MNRCLAQVQAVALRVARLDTDGSPLPGAQNLYVSDALTRLAYTVEMHDGEEFVVPAASGDLCVNFKQPDLPKRLAIELEICTPDPELHEILAGGDVAEDGAARGWAFPELGAVPVPNGVSIEAWTRQLAPEQVQDATFPFARWVWPRVYLVPGARTIENSPLQSEFGGHAVQNPEWGLGPAHDFGDATVTDRVVFWLEETDVPDVECGYQELLAS